MPVARPDQPREIVAGDGAAENINSLVLRVAGPSIAEIDRLIAELTSVREMLRSEADRVQREIGGFASLSQAAMTSTKIIADSMAQWQPPSKQQT